MEAAVVGQGPMEEVEVEQLATPGSTLCLASVVSTAAAS